ncbi:hypothetical protein BBP40_008558 [Aspergillus hancockii]|nr:hypothetical protein BBP40_008558 [Aspergillus hancockii]
MPYPWAYMKWAQRLRMVIPVQCPEEQDVIILLPKPADDNKDLASSSNQDHVPDYSVKFPTYTVE